MKIYLIIGKNVDLKSFPFEKDSLKVGIDHGSILALKNHVSLDYAIGDFDSCNEEEKELISLHVPHIISLNPIKDDTDTKHAYNLWKEEKEVSFVLLGGIQGKRIEHFYANLELVMKDERVSLLDDTAEIFSFHENKKFYPSEYKFVCFFPVDEKACLSLKGFAYDIDHTEISKGDGLGVSNEIKEDVAEVIIHSGKLLAFFSKNDNSLI